MSNPTANFGWVMPTATDLVTDLPADFAVFGQAVDTSMAGLLGGTTGQVLSKTSGTNMAFTWVTAQVGDITAVNAGTGISGGGTSGDVTITNSMATAITTSGDLIQGTGSGTFARLGTGTSGQYLTTNGTTNSWVTPGGGMTLLSTTALSTNSVTISGITGSYNSLKIFITGVTTSAAARLRIAPNASTTITELTYNSFSPATSGGTNDDYIGFPQDTTVAASQSNFTLDIDYYANTSAWKAYKYAGGLSKTISMQGAGQIKTTSAITSLVFSLATGAHTFTAGSVLIYGVK